TTRIAPYVRDAVDDSAMPFGVLPKAGILPAQIGSGWMRLSAVFMRAFGDTTALSARLARAGSRMNAAEFRGRQLGWALAGFGLGSALVVILALNGRMSPV